ncbi:hypothetical protein D9M71_383270 [compost metagenome]
MSAARNDASRLVGAWVTCTTPMLTVVTNGRPFQTKCRFCTVWRKPSLIFSATSAGQFSSRMPNSSPPRRARVSPSRRLDCNKVQMCRSNSSPAACPQVSLTSLNWSRSRNIRV